MIESLQGADMEKKNISPFAAALRTLLDDHGTSRAQWAQILGVSEPAISHWVNDVVFPRPEILRGLLGALISDRRVPADALEDFEKLLRQRSTEVTPHGERVGSTIAQYLVKPVREGFLRTLETLPPEGQEVVLQEGAARCRQLRATPVVRRTIEERRRMQFEQLVQNAVTAPAKATPEAQAHADEDERVADQVPQLRAQAWLQTVLLKSFVVVGPQGLNRQLRLARLINLQLKRSHQPPQDSPSPTTATDLVVQGVLETMEAAKRLGTELRQV